MTKSNFKMPKRLDPPKCKPCIMRWKDLIQPLTDAFSKKHSKAVELRTVGARIKLATEINEQVHRENKVTAQIRAEHEQGLCGGTSK